MSRLGIRSLMAVKICISKHSGIEERKTADRAARSLELVTMWPRASWCHPLEPIFSAGQRKSLNEVMSRSLGGMVWDQLAPPSLPREPSLHSS